MAPQGVIVDEAIMAKAARDFDDTAIQIRDMMAKLNAKVEGLVGATRNFNGAARLAFDQNKMLLNDRIQKAGVQLTIIGQKFSEVMNQHATFSRDQGVKIAQTVSAVQPGGIVSGLNG